MKTSTSLKADFCKLIRQIASYKDPHTVFRDFLESIFCALAKTSLPPTQAEQAQTLEDRYMRVVHSYKDLDDFRKFPELLSFVILGLQNQDCDFLGEVAGELGSLSKWGGQFFTPFALSQLIAQMNVSADSIATHVKDKGYFSVSEPAIGAGGMILALGKTFSEAGFDIEKTVYVEGWDVSETAFQMAYIQLSLANIPAKLIRGNSLSLERFETYLTPSTHIFALHPGYGPVYGEPMTKTIPPSASQEVDVISSPFITPQQMNLL